MKNNKERHQTLIDRYIAHGVMERKKYKLEDHLIYFRTHKPYSCKYNIKEKCSV